MSTVGIDEEKKKRYVKYQEERDKSEEGDGDEFTLF